MSAGIPLDPSVVQSVSVHVRTDGGVDAVFAALAGRLTDEQPNDVTHDGHAWRRAAVNRSGVRITISGPHHPMDLSVPEIDRAAGALVVGAEP